MASASKNKVEEDEEVQSSIYSLTLDEIQNTVCDVTGKSFGSMNMDELLTNIWNVEEAATDSAAPPPAAPLHRQASLTVPAPLCRKTVDEVWADIHKGGGGGGGGGNVENAERQPTFGEMTLEDFLVKAGVVREGLVPMPQNYGMPPDSYGQRMTVESAMSPGSSGGGQVDDGGGGGVGMEVKMNGRKRTADGVVEKVVERRQRRMIKNRESAARSRARKQAYTVELEAELNQLREENFRLREEEVRITS